MDLTFQSHRCTTAKARRTQISLCSGGDLNSPPNLLASPPALPLPAALRRPSSPPCPRNHKESPRPHRNKLDGETGGQEWQGQQFTIAIFRSDLTGTVFFCPMKKSFQLRGQASEGLRLSASAVTHHSLLWSASELIYPCLQFSSLSSQNGGVGGRQASKKDRCVLPFECICCKTLGAMVAGDGMKEGICPPSLVYGLHSSLIYMTRVILAAESDED
ncbi:Homeobox-leucine zipper protein [Musa troglodytarum]|uniref:Homeobox-leucine zipper protein n=1 Tax=Musa troglodytarum TaxID=320322 RepID=A0A9E7FTU1_9LILI|nr:Homeobox-leucine zipper protein [Musa troglodytarum]